MSSTNTKQMMTSFAVQKEPEEMTIRELKRIEMAKTKAKLEKSLDTKTKFIYQQCIKEVDAQRERIIAENKLYMPVDSNP